MTHAIPRLTFVSTGGGNAAQAVARDVAEALTRGGLRVALAVVGADRDIPTPETLRMLGLATGRAVHRLDPRLMPAPILQRTLLRAAESADIALVVAPSRPPSSPGDGADGGHTNGHATPSAGNAPDRGISRGFRPSPSDRPVTSILYDVLEALVSPVVLCTDAAHFEQVGASVVRGTLAAADRLGRHGPEVASDPLVLVLEHGSERYGPAIRAAGGFEVVSVAPSAVSLAGSLAGGEGSGSATDPRVPAALSSRDLERLLTRARRAAPLPPVIRHPKRHARARVGLVLDDCFDLYDEESLVQFEVAGAELTPVSALDDRGLETLDGLIIGDGRIERHSVRLAANRSFRNAVKKAVEAGVPTLASGGGFAYLTQGLRTLGGSLHPFAGALEGHAIAVAQKLPSGHVEVALEGETIVGPLGTHLRGFVQRAWLLRGLSIPERRIYGTVSGPPDIGCASHSLFCTHFRPYWPSAPASAPAFVDHCVSYAALRDVGLGLESGSTEGRGFGAGSAEGLAE